MATLNFSNINVLVIGDVMLDQYYKGASTRMSPEAPVPVIDVQNQYSKPGGAANVAANLSALGAKPLLMGIVGNDVNAGVLVNELEKTNVIAPNFITDKSRPTTVKNRVYNAGTYVCRFDHEVNHNISKEIEQALLQQLKQAISNQRIDVAILQDYNKGIFTKSFINATIALLNKHNIKITVDPKVVNFFEFKQVDLFKPNLREIETGLKLKLNPQNLNEIKQAVIHLKEKIRAQNLLLTLSQYGAVSADFENNFFHSPAFKRNIIDVSGAGDTVISVASLLLAQNYALDSITKMSNLAGGLVCEFEGVERLMINDLNQAIANAGIKL